jgi:hypothetical protein
VVSPTAFPRLRAIKGSGETSPTMVATHRELFGRLGEEATASVGGSRSSVTSAPTRMRWLRAGSAEGVPGAMSSGRVARLFW